MKKMMLSFCAVAAVLLAGCVATPPAPTDRRVTVAPDLGVDLQVTDIRCVKGSSEFNTFQANVVNTTTSALPVQWKVQWLDADGVEIESLVSTWNSLMLQPLEVRALKGTAPRPDAADMLFYVRRGK